MVTELNLVAKSGKTMNPVVAAKKVTKTLTTIGFAPLIGGISSEKITAKAAKAIAKTRRNKSLVDTI